MEGKGLVKVQLRQIVNSHHLAWENLEFSTSCHQNLECSTSFPVTSRIFNISVETNSDDYYCLYFILFSSKHVVVLKVTFSFTS